MSQELRPQDTSVTSVEPVRQPTLEVTRLSVSLPAADRPLTLVERFDLTTFPNERVAIVGESGSGKTVTAQALMRLNPHMRLTGSIKFGAWSSSTCPRSR